MTEDAAALAEQWLEGRRAGAWSVAAGRGARQWAAGWDRSAPAPAAPRPGDASPGGRGWRTWRGRGAEPARQERHRRRVQVVHELRRAGYLARHRWARAEGAAGVYLEGPAQGLRAVDPWAEARHLSSCSARWQVDLRLGGQGLQPAPRPMPCGRGHLCPVCAADRSSDYAQAARAVLERLQAEGQVGALALMTLTQRAHPGERLQDALQRLRRAWRAVRRADAWRLGAAGGFWGYEVTWRKNRGWHAHLHVVVACAAGQLEADVRGGLGRAWRLHTDLEAEAAGLEGYGWAPAAGGCRTAPARLERPHLEDMTARQLRALCGGGQLSASRWAAGVRAASRLRRAELLERLRGAWRAHERRHGRQVLDWRGAWWRTMNDLEAVKQAAKYPSPVGRLPGLQLAEFLACARGRRWHDGCGALRGVLAQAAELAQGADSPLEDDAGVIVTQSRPGACPDLDSVGPDLGWRDSAPDARPGAAEAQLEDVQRWALAAAWAGAPELEVAAQAAGLVYVLGPAPGVPPAARIGWRPAAAGEAPAHAGEALYLQAPAGWTRARLLEQVLSLATLPPVPRAVQRRAPRPRLAPAPPAWARRGLPPG
jgi:hypothetical protein